MSLGIGILIWLPELISGYFASQSKIFIDFTTKLQERPLAVAIISELLCFIFDISISYSYLNKN